MKSKISVYIPARLNSQRLPQKALMDFGGKPLVLRILEELKKVEFPIDFFLNSNSDKIIEVIEEQGFKSYKRRDDLAKETTTTEEILADFVEGCKCEYVAVINPTNPLLKAGTIDDFFGTVLRKGFDTAFSVSTIQKHLLIDNIPVNYSPFGPHPRTQDVKPVKMLNWAIVMWKTKLVQEKIKERGDSIYLGNVGFVDIPDIEATDIDTKEDFNHALYLFNHQ